MASGFGLLVFNPKQEREAKVLRNSVLKHFQHLEDPRADRGRNHSLVSIITIAILAVLAGADGFVAIEAYGQAKQSWLETFLDLPKGIPSHDTFGRVLGMLEPKQLESGFLAWIEEREHLTCAMSINAYSSQKLENLEPDHNLSSM